MKQMNSTRYVGNVCCRLLQNLLSLVLLSKKICIKIGAVKIKFCLFFEWMWKLSFLFKEIL
jgi:hypothetical protein